MDGSVTLSAQEHKTLLHAYRYHHDREVSRRAHVLLLLAQGWSYRQLQASLFASNDLIARCATRFRSGGVAAVLDEHQPEKKILPTWLASVARWVLTKTPQDFSFFRTRWSCETLREVLWWELGIHKSIETIRRGLHRMNLVWRRPRPILGPKDEQYEEKLDEIKHLLRELPADATAVFQDEVDVNLNPKIGPAWMLRGQQATVTTPGNNVKRYLAGSLTWQTGTLFVSSPARRRNTELFLALSMV